MATLSDEKVTLELESIRDLLDDRINSGLKIVAEGDSWFDYPFHRDIIDHLRRMGYAIKKHSKAGDELENMVFNSISLDAVLSSVRILSPKFVIFSAGGNDVVGQEMKQYLNHKGTGLPPLKLDIFRDNMNGQVKIAITDFVNKVHAIDPNIHVIMHGYDYARPNGTKFEVLGIGFKGPWILPAFESKGLFDRAIEQDPIIKEMVDIFNQLLSDLQIELPNFHHVDIRGQFPDDNLWDNEIHLKSNGFKEVANRIHEKIVEILNENPLDNRIIA